MEGVLYIINMFFQDIKFIWTDSSSEVLTDNCGFLSYKLHINKVIISQSLVLTQNQICRSLWKRGSIGHAYYLKANTPVSDQLSYWIGIMQIQIYKQISTVGPFLPVWLASEFINFLVLTWWVGDASASVTLLILSAELTRVIKLMCFWQLTRNAFRYQSNNEQRTCFHRR